MINKIFSSLKAIFPAWTAAIRDSNVEAQARQEWLKGLVENQIDDAQLEGGLARCRRHSSPFLPSIGQFIEWCKESSGPMAGMPSEVEARLAMYRESAKPRELRTWSMHPAVYWVYRQRHSGDWQHMTERDSVRAFGELWAAAVDMARSGRHFEQYVPPQRQISPENNRPKASSEDVSKAMAELKSMLGCSEAEK